MRQETAHTLAQLTSQFYETVEASFSATRANPWPGWARVLDETQLRTLAREPHTTVPVKDAPAIRLLDLACGNLRFERYLARELADGCPDDASPAATTTPLLQVYAYDNCDALVAEDPPAGVQLSYTHLDVSQALLTQHDLRLRAEQADCDLAVCFGFMHHLALPAHRVRVLEALVESVRPAGFVAVSFWQLSRSDKLLAKARATTHEATARLDIEELGPRDYLLGWQGRTDVLRYCHDFSEEELDELVATLGTRACEVARFSTDGATGNLNRYLILRRIR